MKNFLIFQRVKSLLLQVLKVIYRFCILLWCIFDSVAYTCFGERNKPLKKKVFVNKSKFRTSKNKKMLAGHIKDQAAYLDKNISYQIYSLGRRYQKQTRKYLKGLEYSCHGIPWLTLTTLLCYINSSNTSYVHLLIGLIFDIIYVAVAKASFRRRRPTYASQEDQMIMIGYDKLSFPSGHTSRAIYVALFYSGYWYSLFIWIWALAVSGSRVVYGRHFVGDLIGGLVVGYFNYVTQFTLFYPIHAMMEWFINSLLMETAGGD